MKLVIISAACCILFGVVNCAYSVKPKCEFKCCVETCKRTTTLWWQRFCSLQKITLYCYEHQYLYVKKAMYGNIVCSPSNLVYTGSHTCGPADSDVLAVVRKYCDYKTICTGTANPYIIDGNPTPFAAYTCPYGQDHVYIEYFCRNKKDYCNRFCTCKGKGQDDTYCQQNYKSYSYA